MTLSEIEFSSQEQSSPTLFLQAVSTPAIKLQQAHLLGQDLGQGLLGQEDWHSNHSVLNWKQHQVKNAPGRCAGSDGSHLEDIKSTTTYMRHYLNNRCFVNGES